MHLCPADQVEAKRSVYGYNELEKPPQTPLWKLVLQQFDEVLVKVRGRHESVAEDINLRKGLGRHPTCN